jgi:hypothetical protein
MESKLIEIRDRATFVPVLCTSIEYNDGFLARRAGFGDRMIFLTMLTHPERTQYDPFSWGDRTLHVAHAHIERYWDELEDHAVVDVEFILGERETPKESESHLERS